MTNLENIDQMIVRMKRWLIIACSLFVLAAVAGGLWTYHQKKKADAALAEAAVLQIQLDDEKDRALLAEQERKLKESEAAEHELAAASDKKTIAQLKNTVAILKKQQPIGNQATPLEGAQDNVIDAQDHLTADQDAALASLHGALDASIKETSHYQGALSLSEKQTEALRTALKNLPKSRPHSLTFGAGKDFKGQTIIAGSYGQSFGAIRVEVIATSQGALVLGGWSW